MQVCKHVCIAMYAQARSQGGSLGAEEPPFLNRRSISLLKRSTILLKKP